MNPSLTHIRLVVEEYQECFRFYSESLDLEVTFGDATSGYADFDTGSVTLALHAAEDLASALDSAVGQERGRDTATLILQVENVDSAYEELDEANCTRISDPQNMKGRGVRVAHVRDPDGNLIELNNPLEL